MKNSEKFLDRLVKEICDGVASEPPAGSFLAAELAEKAGLSVRRANDILREKMRRGQVSRVWVRRGSARVAYWTPA
jgi:hypothetical protein